MDEAFLIRKSAGLEPVETRRAGVRERRLLTQADSRHQNLVLIDTEPGAQVELHAVATSESLYILQGSFRVSAPGAEAVLGPGDLCHFAPGSAHALECLAGPGQFLAVFAPPAGALGGDNA